MEVSGDRKDGGEVLFGLVMWVVICKELVGGKDWFRNEYRIVWC